MLGHQIPGAFLSPLLARLAVLFSLAVMTGFFLSSFLPFVSLLMVLLLVFVGKPSVLPCWV